MLSQLTALITLVPSLLCVLVAADEAFQHPRKVGKRCTGEIQSLGDVAAAQECTTIVIGGFTVPGGQTFALAPPDGAVVSLTGQVTWSVANWAGPLFTITGNNISFNGNGHVFQGNGDQYWDGLGGGGGVEKPAPFMRINSGGSFSNLRVVNAPQRTISVGGNSVTVSNITIDNSAGDLPNSRSGGKPAGHNTDGFDVSAHDVTIQNSVIKNQDDCLAINRGTNIVFTGNTCSGGHGISIGSINSNTIVSGVTISNNHVTNNGNGLRIKTDAIATGSSVSGVTYSGNTLSGITDFGVLIDQSYPDVVGTPGTGVIISGITFSGTNTISVTSTGRRVEVNCGSTTSCPGTWNFAGLTVTGGTAGAIKNAHVTGGSF